MKTSSSGTQLTKSLSTRRRKLQKKTNAYFRSMFLSHDRLYFINVSLFLSGFLLLAIVLDIILVLIVEEGDHSTAKCSIAILVRYFIYLFFSFFNFSTT